MLVGRANLRVGGLHTTKVLSLANKSDTDKSDVLVGKRTVSYNVANDVSFVYTKKPVSHKSGVPYSYKFYVGQKVTIAGYYKGEFQTKEAHIIGCNVPLETGQAQLNENLILDIHLSPGTSGSAVIDERGNLLGMIVLSGVLKFSSGSLTTSIALPARVIAKALLKLDPLLGAAIFKDIPQDAEEPQSAQIPWEFYQESDLPGDTSPTIPQLSAALGEVSDPVGRLRAKSEDASELMINFITTQCLVQGTQKPICHELTIIDEQQTFRKMSKNGKLGKPTSSFPIQKHGVWTQTDWMDTLEKIADNPWIFRGSVENHYLFTFKSAAEDNRCHYGEYSQGTPLFGEGHNVWNGSVVCFEQILTDEDFNVLSVFTEMHPPDACLAEVVQTAIYYDWIKLDGLTSPILLPIRERITAQILGQRDLWYATVSWTDYKKFRAEHKIEF